MDKLQTATYDFKSLIWLPKSHFWTAALTGSQPWLLNFNLALSYLIKKSLTAS